LVRAETEDLIKKPIPSSGEPLPVIGLGPNIFYGTQLAACIMIFRSQKPANRRKKVLFIDASEQIRVGRAQNFLEKEHVDRIYDWYRAGTDVENHVKVASMEEIAENDFNLNIPLYVEKIVEDNLPTVEEALADLKQAWSECQQAEAHLKEKLREFGVSI
jgi:type I restriction enzyme M protein